MRNFLLIGLLVGVCSGLGTSAAASAATSAPLTLRQYVQALDDALAVARELKNDEPQRATDLSESLPAQWNVEAGGRNFEVSTESIRSDLRAWQKKPDEASLDRILRYLETLRQQALAYETPAPDFATRRAALNSILARNEFRNIHGTTWLDRLKQRLTKLLIKLLGKAFQSSAIPVISDIVVYGLILAAVLALAYWLYRSLRDDARLETIMPVPIPVSAKEWSIWMTDARLAGSRGEWRDAIHLAYWGGISFLEAQGAWRPDIARTPREYLRILPRSSVHQPALRALTMQLEAVWYGMHTADAEGFEQALAELERLGCPCN
jgi:hypothetical protein